VSMLFLVENYHILMEMGLIHGKHKNSLDVTVVNIININDLTSQWYSSQRMASFTFNCLVCGVLSSYFTEK